MPASPAQILANQANSARSTGPRTSEGKENSRQNALKHGLTGAGVVLPVEDAAEVERRVASFRAELQPSSSVGLTLVRRAATLAVRMEKCADRELADTAERVARAMIEFEPPEGISEAESNRLRAEAGRAASFDPSQQACLARRYEAAAERGFYRALKELRLVEKQPSPIDPARQLDLARQELGSFLEMTKSHARDPEPLRSTPQNRLDQVAPPPLPRSTGIVDVPFTIGKPR
jgi:hypothetical protein